MRRFHLFSPAARAAASVARIKQAAAQAMLTKAHEVFVTRGSCEAHEFTWEIRQFGGTTVQETAECFASRALARDAGETALALRNSMNR